MKIQPANINSSNKSMLLSLMRESHLKENSATPAEWAKTEAAITILLDDSQAGEAYLILNETGEPSRFKPQRTAIEPVSRSRVDPRGLPANR